MGASQRRKGANGELELIRLLRDELGEDWVTGRNQDQNRESGLHDFTVAGIYRVECKRRRACTQADIDGWWQEAVSQCGEAEPLLAYRVDRQPWRFRFIWGWSPTTEDDGAPFHYVIETDLRTACEMIRETWAEVQESGHTIRYVPGGSRMVQ